MRVFNAVRRKEGVVSSKPLSLALSWSLAFD